MKDQYFGDVNDFRKYRLLLSLSISGGLSLGVCRMPSEGQIRREVGAAAVFYFRTPHTLFLLGSQAHHEKLFREVAQSVNRVWGKNQIAAFEYKAHSSGG